MFEETGQDTLLCPVTNFTQEFTLSFWTRLVHFSLHADAEHPRCLLERRSACGSMVCPSICLGNDAPYLQITAGDAKDVRR